MLNTGGEGDRRGQTPGRVDGRVTMRIAAIRLGWPESVLAVGLLGVGGVVVWAIRSGWAIALIPGVTYLVAGVAAYAIYRAESRLRELAAAVSFRVVEARGECLLGRRGLAA
jgi:hypothetical protein